MDHVFNPTEAPHWQTGRPPKDGWYWSRPKSLPDEIECRYFDLAWINETTWNFREWSGPLLPP